MAPVLAIVWMAAGIVLNEKDRFPRDESRGKRYLLHTAKDNGRTDPATCTTAANSKRTMESVASVANLAQALLNVLRNKGRTGNLAPGPQRRAGRAEVDGHSRLTRLLLSVIPFLAGQVFLGAGCTSGSAWSHRTTQLHCVDLENSGNGRLTDLH
jgi:hypothetical protein